MWLSMMCVLVPVYVLLSPSMRLDNVELGLGSCVATFKERAAHSVLKLFVIFVVCIFIFFIIFQFGYEGESSVLIALVP